MNVRAILKETMQSIDTTVKRATGHAITAAERGKARQHCIEKTTDESHHLLATREYDLLPSGAVKIVTLSYRQSLERTPRLVTIDERYFNADNLLIEKRVWRTGRPSYGTVTTTLYPSGRLVGSSSTALCEF
jgi:hypothetical protein